MSWLLAVATAVLWVLCFPPFGAAWLAPLALTPLLTACARETRGPRRFAMGYAAGVMYWAGVCHWIQFTLAAHGGVGAAGGWALFALFCLVKALQTGVFAWLAGYAMGSRMAAACIAALDVLLEEPQRIERLWKNTSRFKQGLKSLGFETGPSETPITPVIVGKGAAAMELSDRLFQRGVFAQGIGYPTVPEGRARVRTIVTSAHTEGQLDRALEAFASAGRELGVIS